MVFKDDDLDWTEAFDRLVHAAIELALADPMKLGVHELILRGMIRVSLEDYCMNMEKLSPERLNLRQATTLQMVKEAISKFR